MEKIKTIEMVRQIRDAQYILTKDMSEEQLIAYFRKKARDVNKKISESLKKQDDIKKKAA